MKIFTHNPYYDKGGGGRGAGKGEIKTRNARFHALIKFDLHSFDQNILRFDSSLS